MESIPYNHLLPVPPNALDDIRKLHNLDKPGRLNEAIDILENWLSKQDHILKKDFDRGYLERCLISCKGSVEKAKTQIDRLCTMKTLLPQFFAKTNVKKELIDVLARAWLVPLPVLTDDFYRVFVVKVNSKNFTDEIFLEYFQYNIILCEYIKAHDYVNGVMMVFDLQEINIVEMVTRMNPMMLQQFMSILIEGYGARMKSIHLLTSSKTVELLMKLIKQFLTSKISKRIHVQKTLDDLYKVIPKHLLPEEYGGKEKSIAKLIDDCIEDLSTEQHVKYVEMMRLASTDEKLRRSDKFNEEYMGMPGSFRNMSVD